MKMSTCDLAASFSGTLANERAQTLLQDHRRVRKAADAKGSYQVTASLPVDVMGVYVLLPTPPA
ncbi:MAG: hypothetical protein ACT4P0_03050 [Panacagrimonas sp.]